MDSFSEKGATKAGCSKAKKRNATVNETKPQNWNAAKPPKGYYACLAGCALMVPESERDIHDEHCPGRRYHRQILNESKHEYRLRKIQSGQTTPVGSKPGQEMERKLEEEWEEEVLKAYSAETLRRKKMDEKGERLLRKLEKLPTEYVVGMFVGGVIRKRLSPGPTTD